MGGDPGGSGGTWRSWDFVHDVGARFARPSGVFFTIFGGSRPEGRRTRRDPGGGGDPKVPGGTWRSWDFVHDVGARFARPSVVLFTGEPRKYSLTLTTKVPDSRIFQ